MLVAALTMAATLASVFGETPLSPTSAWAQVSSCGNGFLDPGEDCDLSSPSGAFCPPGQVCDSNCDCVPVATTTQPTTTVVPTTTTPTTSTVTTSTTLLNHFQCYEAKRQAITAGTVTIVDQFGSSSAALSKPNRLCAPTNKQNEDPGAQNDPDHLKSWQNKHTRPRVLNQTIVNQFGTLVVDVHKPAFMLVPASKSLVGNPPPLAGPTVDHFQCYKIRRSKGTPKFTKIVGVTGVDQFGAYTLDLLKPRWLCAPANKSGEDPTAPSHPEHLLCYKSRNSGLQFVRRNAFTTDQFGNQTLDLIRRIELCVPSLKNPGVTTTSTTAAPTTTVVTTTVATTTVPTTTVVTTTVTTSTTTTTTLYGSPSRAFVDPVRSLLD
jgi:hypothetical protein